MGAFDWTRWPYDPENIDKRVIHEAVEALRHETQDGVHMVERATNALDVALGMLPSKVDGWGRHGEVLAMLDRANRDVRRLLEDAMDAVYKAVSVLDNLP
jgi:hypothetical protein